MKRILTVITMLAALLQISARQISPDEALETANRFVRGNSRLRALSQAQMKLAYVKTEGSQNRLYVFNASTGGFVIVSGSDATEQVLGYGTSGSFDAQNMAPGLADMLDIYSEEIGYAIDNNIERTSAPVQTADTRPSIAPMLKTQWGQSTPFNNLCPMVGSNRSVTGCLATAMAQVMKHHNWPEVGEGSRSYEATLGGETVTLSVDFGETTYDWENMLNNYSSGYNEQQANAVATLLYSCGVACGMNYATSTAPSAELFKALPNNFKYDKSIKMAEKAYYGIDEWNDIVYNELSNGRVVYLAGYNAKSGHAFVCDGYDKDDYFHINWGWVGLDDGYFKMSALDPSEQGIGGSDAGYSKGLEMVYNIKKDQGGEATIEIGFHGECNINRGTADLGSMTELVFGVTGMTSFSIFKDYYYMRLGIMAVNESTSEETFVQSNNIYWCILSSYYYSLAGKNIRVYANAMRDLADGTYRLYPAIYDMSHELYAKGRVYPGKTPYVIMVKEGNNATFRLPSVDKPLLNAALTQNTQLYKNYRYSVTATVTNRGGDYCQYIYPVLLNYDDLTVVHQGDGLMYELRNGESMTQEHITRLPADIAPGNYYLAMADYEGNLISMPAEVTVKENSGSYTLRASSFTIEN
ncbi:MAG: C10 family peptidase, partial [Muribaculaceae bacterium]|nr:C10 family peptidase [Muribaculaceae bacterium]